MTRSDCPYGFRVVGSVTERRRLVDHAAAFRGHAGCDDGADPSQEAYLSAFLYPVNFKEHLERAGSPKGYSGPCWSPRLWFDIDRKGGGMTLVEIAPGVTQEDIKSKTEAEYRVALTNMV